MEFTACSFFMLSDGWCDSTTVSVAEVFHGFNRFGVGFGDLRHSAVRFRFVSKTRPSKRRCHPYIPKCVP